MYNINEKNYLYKLCCFENRHQSCVMKNKYLCSKISQKRTKFLGTFLFHSLFYSFLFQKGTRSFLVPQKCVRSRNIRSSFRSFNSLLNSTYRTQWYGALVDTADGPLGHWAVRLRSTVLLYVVPSEVEYHLSAGRTAECPSRPSAASTSPVIVYVLFNT